MQRKKKTADSDDDEEAVLSGSDVEMRVAVTPRSERPGRRAATTKRINYSGLLNSDEDEASSDGELVFKENEAVKAPTHTVQVLSDEVDSEIDDFQPEDDSPIKKKPAAAKRPRKKGSSPDSDDGAKKVSASGVY